MRHFEYFSRTRRWKISFEKIIEQRIMSSNALKAFFIVLHIIFKEVDRVFLTLKEQFKQITYSNLNNIQVVN